jgi:hypothetical protein
MKSTWLKLALLAFMTLSAYAALTVVVAQDVPRPEDLPVDPRDLPAAAPTDTAPGGPARAPRTDPVPSDTDADEADGGFLPPSESKPIEELPPDLRETADFDVSFPIDI